MPPEYGRHPPRGRVGQLEALEQAIHDRVRVLDVPEPGHQNEVLSPGENFVDGRELSGEADGLPHLLAASVATSKPLTLADPASALRSVDRMFTTVVLPAVRAEQGEDAAPRHVEVHPAQCLDLFE